MDDREGMVYVFCQDSTRGFVNGNPRLDLDIIMVDAKGRITAVHTMKHAAVSEGETGEGKRKKLPAYASPEPYRYVFELRSGAAKMLGARAGERLDVDYFRLHPFRNAENIRYAFQLKKIVPKKDWIAPLLRRMEDIVSSPDSFRELNLEFVGGKQNLQTLLSCGWVRLEGIDSDRSENLWLQKEIDAVGQHGLARLCVSRAGHFRHVYFLPLTDGGAWRPLLRNENFDAEADAIRPDLSISQIEPPPAEIEEELENIVWNLRNPSVKDEWSERQKKFYIWGKEFFRLSGKSRYYGYRLLDGMLRFDDFCDDDFAMSGPLCTAANLNYRWAMAKLAILALTHMSESDNPFFWNDLGYALDCLAEREAAFYCFANAWNREFDALYANNLWLVGNAIIPDLLRKQNWNTLLSVVSVMLSAVSDKATVKQQLEVLCIVGLIYEKRCDFEEADKYYAAACDIYERKNGGSKKFRGLRWDFPVLYQALMRARTTDRKSCSSYVDAQLKTFPKTPLESGFEERLPVEYVEGDGHGDHWTSVVEDEQLKDPEKFFGVMIREGKVDFEGTELPVYERGGDPFTRGTGFRYSAKDDQGSPVESYFLVGTPEKGDSHQFASAFPVFKRGRGSSLIRALRSVNIWENAVEATVEFDLRKNGSTLAFFLPDHCGQFLRLKPDTAYRIELGVFAYSVGRFEEREFKIDKGPMLAEEKLRLRKEGKDDNIDSVTLHVTSEFCNITRSFSGWADDISVTAPIDRIERFTFLGNNCLTLWLKFDERGAGITLPVFLKEGNLADGYRPQTGDVVECVGWLQGWVHESREPGVSIEIPEEEDDGEDDDDLDFEQLLWSGVRGTDHDLNELAVRALERKGKVRELCRCPEALPGDADFSCRVNGSVKFVKVMTGYFENEDLCRAAWKEFCVHTAPRPDGRPVHLLSVVGIKLCDDQYKIHYNGFSKLNPAAEKDDDELDLEPSEKVLRYTPQEMAEIMAKAWQDLDVRGVRELLADGYTYTSMWIFETMDGADKYLGYLSTKFESIRDGGCKPVVTAVRSDEHYVEIELRQSVHGKTKDSMLQFEIRDGKIISGWMCEPSFRRVE